MVKDIKQVKRFILVSEPIKYEIKYKQALVKGSAKAGRTARKCEPPAIPCSKPKPVKACECLLLFHFEHSRKIYYRYYILSCLQLLQYNFLLFALFF